MENPEIHLLSDIETTNLVQASSGKRFANYIIDFIIFYVIIFVLSMLFALLSPAFTVWVDELSNDAGYGLLDRLFTLIIYGIIMGIIEGITKGRTLGKLITGTRAVNQDGTPITFLTALLRGICRAVPFDNFSALGSPSFPWHDKWSKTYVIDIKESTINQ